MPLPVREVRCLDLFCGAGGSSCGARAAGATVVGGIDGWDVAAQTFKLNFPAAEVWRRKIESLPPKEVAAAIGRVDLLLASPECTNHTFAKGNLRQGPEQEKSRMTAFQVIRYARALRPRWLVVENVVSMRKWPLYRRWTNSLTDIGYHLEDQTLNAQDFGVPQSRRRLFVVGDLLSRPSIPEPISRAPVTVKSILHHAPTSNGFNYTMTPVFGPKPRAKGTMERIRRAVVELGDKTSFLVVYYGTDAAGGWQTLERPLRTITTLDRFALVMPSKDGPMMRMLQPPELASAMGFPNDYVWPDVTRRERIKLVGNAVAAPVMKAVVEALISDQVCAASVAASPMNRNTTLFP